jgi:hypothetical protein
LDERAAVLDLIERLTIVFEERATEMSAKAKAIPFRDAFGRGHYSGYAAASRMDAELLRSLREEVEATYIEREAAA